MEDIEELAEFYGMTVEDYMAWVERMARIQARNHEAATFREQSA